MNRLLVALILLIASWFSPRNANADLDATQIGQGKASTALVIVSNNLASGTAFCIHKQGYFLTNAHVVARANGSLTLVLDPGETSERTLKAGVVRTDDKLDLALLRSESAENLTALPLGTVDQLFETAQITAFGFPFGTALKLPNRDYPQITVNVGRISALRKSDEQLEQVQLDAQLSPGNSGGPVVDRNARVIGVVRAGIVPGGIILAIPVTKVREFLKPPLVEFEPPRISVAKQQEPITLTARVIEFLPEEKPASVFLEWTPPSGKLQRIVMEPNENGKCSVRLIPVPKRGDVLRLRITAKFDQDIIQGQIDKIDLQFDQEKLRMDDVREIERHEKGFLVRLHDGSERTGDKISGLPSRIRVGTLRVNVDLSQADRLSIRPDNSAEGPIHWAIVAERQGQKIARTEGQVFQVGETPVGVSGEKWLALGGQSPWPSIFEANDKSLYTKEGLILKERSLIYSKAEDFLNRDFIWEIAFTLKPTVEGSGKNKSEGVTFIGLGTRTTGAYSEPHQGVYLRIHPPDLDDGSVGLSKVAAQSGLASGHIRRAGTHIARIQKRGNVVSFQIDVDSDGESPDDLLRTVPDITQFAPFLHEKNTFLLFGGGATFTKTRLTIDR